MAFQLRPYQDESTEAAVKFIQDVKDTKNKIIVGPVGCGKSIIIAETVKRSISRIIVFAPNKELVAQNYAKYKAYGYLNAGVFCASLKLKEVREVTFASIQSAVNCIDQFTGFDVAIIDECHNVSPDDSTMYMRFIQGAGIKKVLGLTAMPIRLYSTMQGASSRVVTNTRPKFWDEILYHIPVKLMTDNNWWSKIKYYPKKFDSSSLQLNSSGNNYTEASIKRSIVQNGTTGLMIKHLLQRKGDMSVLVFAPSIADGETIHKAIPFSAVITTKTKPDARTEIVKRFRNGEIKVLINFNVFKEGFDYPDLDGVMIGRPTNSLSWYLQVVGRVVRLATKTKTKFVMDYCGNYTRFGRIEDIDLQKVQMKRKDKYEVFKGNVLMTGISVDQIGSAFLENGVIVKRRMKNQSVKIPYTMPFGVHAGKAVRMVPKRYLEHLTTLPNADAWIQKELDRRVNI